jgi:hypothetical protein
LWPRQREGVVYSVGKPQVEVTENDDFVVIKTNNIPDHDLHTNNPNCASTQNYTFKIPKEPLLFDTPMPVTRDMQAIGVALNGVVIAGPYDSAGQISPYHRYVSLPLCPHVHARREQPYVRLGSYRADRLVI